MIVAGAEGIPSEIDYIYDNWTHFEIARQYGIKVVKNAPSK